VQVAAPAGLHADVAAAAVVVVAAAAVVTVVIAAVAAATVAAVVAAIASPAGNHFPAPLIDARALASCWPSLAADPANAPR